MPFSILFGESLSNNTVRKLEAQTYNTKNEERLIDDFFSKTKRHDNFRS